MFIRETKTVNKKTGAVYVKHRLVESYRTDKGPRQRIVMHLDTLDLPKELWPALAEELERRLAGESAQLSLPEWSPDVSEVADGAMRHFAHFQVRHKNKRRPKGARQLETVDLNSVTTTHCRSLGPELVGHHAWESLGLSDILTECNLTPRERSVAEAVVLGRLIEPGSDLATWRWIREMSAVAELTELDLGRVNKEMIYDIPDILSAHKSKIETCLLDREQKLFPGRDTLYLFDLTNFYFEGQCLGNSLAHHGKSKEKRSDCPLVSLALVVDSDGFPVVSRVYEGNVGEPKTLGDILRDMGYAVDKGQLEMAAIKPTLVMDRGLATKENLGLIRAEGYPFIVIERSDRAKEFAEEFAAWPEGFDRVERDSGEDVWVRKTAGPDDDTARILCKSEGRAAKETAIAERWEKRAEEDLSRLARSVAKGYLRVVDKVQQRLGRLMERYPGLTRRFETEIQIDDSGKIVQAFAWRRKSVDDEGPSVDRSKLLAGCYVIETSHGHLSGVDIWHLYMTLTRVEGAFRSLKSDLGTRPIYHQLERRTVGHLFLSVLAYHLLIFIEHSLGRSGDMRRWSTVRKILRTHQRNTIILTDAEGEIHHLRVSSQPEPSHRKIYAILGVSDPLGQIHTKVGRRV